MPTDARMLGLYLRLGTVNTSCGLRWSISRGVHHPVISPQDVKNETTGKFVGNKASGPLGRIMPGLSKRFQTAREPPCD